MAAKESGADAIKLQTASPDGLTIDCDNKYFNIDGTIWKGKNLYKLYGEVYTSWEWQPKLKTIANNLGLDLFSAPFEDLAVDFLEEMNVPVYKVASFEIVDIPLLKKIASTGKPVIMSTGLANLSEIDEAVRTLKENGCKEIALLKCTSVYPAPPEEMNLRTIPHMAEAFGVPVGLSDHTLGVEIPIAAVSLGACIVEKHFTLSRNVPGPDSAFSLEPHEFKTMVNAIRKTEKALGDISYDLTKNEKQSINFRKSLFAVRDIKNGECITKENVRNIRPGYGIHTRYFEKIIGSKARVEIKRGEPITWELLF